MKKHGLPVDRGWAWMVMVGNFVNVFITLSFIRSLAILFPVFLEKFKQSAAVTTLAFGIGEIMESTANLIIPGVLMSRFSVRSISLVGAFIHSTSIMALAFTSNIVFLNIFFGCIGFSRGLLINPQMYVLGCYFKKRLSFANAFAAMGLSAATLISPLATRFLLDTFALQWTFLIFSAFSLHTVVASLLFRPPSLYQTSEVDAKDVGGLELGEIHIEIDSRDTQLKNKEEDCYINVQAQDPLIVGDSANLGQHRKHDPGVKDAINVCVDGRPEEGLGKTTHTPISDRKCETDASGLQLLVQHEKIDYKEKTPTNDNAKCPTSSTRSKSKTFTRWFHKKVSTSLWSNPVAILLMLATGLGVHTQAGNVYLPVLGLENGLTDSQLPWLLTISGGTDIVAKLVIGYQTDKNCIHPLYVVFLTQVIPGVTFQLVPLFQGMGAMAILCVVYGSTAGILHVLFPPIVVRMVGLPSLPHAVSAYFLINSLVTFVMHMVVGSLKDLTNSFVGGFRFVGALLLTSGLLLLLVRPVSKLPCGRKPGSQHSEDSGDDFIEVETNDQKTQVDVRKNA